MVKVRLAAEIRAGEAVVIHFHARQVRGIRGREDKRTAELVVPDPQFPQAWETGKVKVGRQLVDRVVVDAEMPDLCAGATAKNHVRETVVSRPNFGDLRAASEIQPVGDAVCRVVL